MQNKIKLTILMITISVGIGLSTNAVMQNASKTPAPEKQTSITSTPQTSQPVYIETKSLDIVANPAKYLNKKVKIIAKFDKFSTLGLDYKPAFRSSDKYIGILIKRDDVTNHTVPLSEMKIFLPRDEAEKYVDLEAGDVIEINGVVFSDALGDAWVDVKKFAVISSKSKSKSSLKK